jgi:hypothetical protein
VVRQTHVMTSSPRLPDFLILGAAKAGTSSIHAWLATHPDIQMAEPKETNFFSINYGEGLGNYLACFPDSERRLRGEATPSYLHLPHVAARIAETLPDARLIVVLREPVERAFSDWWMHVRRGAERRSFTEAVGEEMAGTVPADPERFWHEHLHSSTTARVRNTMYVAAGEYAPNISRYLDLFPADRFTILSYRRLTVDPFGFGEALAAALDADPARLGEAPRLNTGSGATWAGLVNQRGKELPLPLRLGLERAAGLLPRRRPPIDKTTRERLEEHYGLVNERLVEFVGAEAAYWVPA